jgi:polyisoprenoid-binding protein YceI
MSFISRRRAWLAPLLIGACAGTTALAAEVYEVDPNHTYPSVEVSHMGISKFAGKFKKTKGTITLDRSAKTGSVDITIDTSSVDFGHDKLDEELRGADWFNVAKFPTATYKGTIKFEGDEPKEIDGQLTLLGVTKPVKLEIEDFKCIQHPMYKKQVCGADAEGEFDRSDFGMKKGVEFGGGKVELEIQVEGLKKS